MVTEILHQSFAQARRRPGLIFLDVIWKLVWFALTMAGGVIVVSRFVSRFQYDRINIQVLDALRFASSVQQLWTDYGAEFLVGLMAVIGMSALVYLFLEATVRRRLVAAGFSPRFYAERGLKPATTSLFVFLGSNIAKLAILGSAAITLLVMSNGAQEAQLTAGVAFTALAFFATIIDTLVRTDAIDLLGVDFFGVTGLIGTLVLFEWLIGASLFVVLIAGFLTVGNTSDALQMVVATALVLLVLNFLHSYLLIVRFSAVGIMRRNVIDV